jgi:IstB-like ATP binding protein
LRSSSPTISAMRPSSKPNERLLQHPASAPARDGAAAEPLPRGVAAVVGGPKLLIVDEIVYLPMTRERAHLFFFRMVAKRHERGSTVPTSNPTFGTWD